MNTLMLFETELTKLFYDLKTGYSIQSEGLSSLQDYVLDIRALLTALVARY